MPCITDHMKLPPCIEGNSVVLVRPRAIHGPDFASAVNETIDMLGHRFAYAKKELSVHDGTRLCVFAENLCEAYQNALEIAHPRAEIPFFVIERVSDTFVGVFLLRNVRATSGRIEIGYWIRKTKQRTGLAHQACNLGLEWLASGMIFDVVEIVTDIGNQGSRKLAAKLGFRERQQSSNSSSEGVHCELSLPRPATHATFTGE